MRLLLVAILGMGACASPGEAPGSHFEKHPLQLSPIQIQTRSRTAREQLRAAKASGVLLDWDTGKILTSIDEQHAAMPGSLLKPFLLSYALQHGIVSTSTRVYCRRSLRVANRSLPCTHPSDQPMLDAQGALSASCNTWFASLAQRMTARDLDEVLQQAHLPHTPAHFDDGNTRILTALGLENVSASPLQIATAYRALLLHEPHTSAVWNGLRGSVAYGMANNARLTGIEVLGKTGTASNPGEWWTHGWFAGGIPNRFVLVVYVPHGDGGSAATLAGTVFRGLLSEEVR
ncbi:penicillin-binding transpeptidase domain-containing protein [Terriglobus sp. RCC_193]|uniref:penicillin-binding transpeptidase domain-containing protein n=1 Tax=Terriglobus sp. RCC_193 TaxID=3239218 RepID=UPI00352504AB